MVVLITGGSGQVAQAIQKIAPNYPEIEFVFCDRLQFDITLADQCESIFNQYQPDYCINTAAYTKVDLAEEQKELALRINADGVKNLANACQKYHTTLIQLSTDFVFNGQKSQPYQPEDIPQPINHYGYSKWRGEIAAQGCPKHYIIRTSWVFSNYGNNFKKTMLHLAETRDEIRVVEDQIGCPTSADSLAKFLVHLIGNDPKSYGIYHFSNTGITSWCGFAKAIFDAHQCTIQLRAIASEEYPTLATRPKYSVLDTTLTEKVFNYTPEDWHHYLA